MAVKIEKPYLADDDDVLAAVGSSRQGLSAAEAEKRIAENGQNKLKAPKGKSLFMRFLEQLTDPMIIILLVAAAVSAVLAVVENEGFADAIIILVVVIANAVLGVVQESKAEAAIEALQKMSAATTKVRRDGKIVVVNSEDIAVGDVVVLEAGDSIPADARIIACTSLKTEEAALTGESTSINKMAEQLGLKAEQKDISLGDRKNMIYMGSSVVYGTCEAVVTAVGMDTEMGKIADALNNAVDGETPLQIKMHQLSGILTKIVIGICVVVFGVQILRAGSINADVALDSFMIAISLAVAAIPEGLAAVVTVVLSIGVTNMSKRRAIVRHMTAVETLGCTQIICSDKTGTLTQNKMTVVDFSGEDEKYVARAFALCTDATLYEGETESTGDPTQTSVVNYAYKLGMPKFRLEEEYPRAACIPFDSSRKLMTTIHRDGSKFAQYTTGAPDVVIGKCTTYRNADGSVKPMTDALRTSILAENKRMADKALRVLAAAEIIWDALPAEVSPENVEHDLCYVGLVGMIDPVRPEVKVAVENCRSAGVKPIMITGDHIDTAVAIAKELGIYTDTSKAITGAQLSELSDEEYNKVYQDISVYARVQPEHKTRIVNTWREHGYVTAMTGDGVNDAPAIKSADIGVGMGITGTDVTKNVADMVLADDNFATIVGAVEEGRRIYDNIRKAIQFLLGSNMSEVICVFIASLLGFTILEPVHLLWINLVTDCFPALSLGTERAEKNIMSRKPRSSKAGIFADGMGFDILYQGIVIAALVFASYFLSGAHGPEISPKAMTMAFITMSLCEIFHSVNMRSQRGSLFSLEYVNMPLLASSFGALVVTVLVCEIAPVAALFGFEVLTIKELLTAGGLALTIIPIVEIVKLIERAVTKKK